MLGSAIMLAACMGLTCGRAAQASHPAYSTPAQDFCMRHGRLEVARISPWKTPSAFTGLCFFDKAIINDETVFAVGFEQRSTMATEAYLDHATAYSKKEIEEAKAARQAPQYCEARGGRPEGVISREIPGAVVGMAVVGMCEFPDQSAIESLTLWHGATPEHEKLNQLLRDGRAVDEALIQTRFRASSPISGAAGLAG